MRTYQFDIDCVDYEALTKMSDCVIIADRFLFDLGLNCDDYELWDIARKICQIIPDFTILFAEQTLFKFQNYLEKQYPGIKI